jgi:PKD repeat protein
VVQGSTSGTHVYNTAGTFTVTVSATDAGGLSGSKSQAVVVSAAVNVAPTCTLSVSPSSGTTPLSVTATGNCTDADNNITKTTLDFGDGTILQTASGTHTYTPAGNFKVVLTATDSGQLSGSASQTVTATATIPLIYVATTGGNIFGFTPDGSKTKTLNAGFTGSLTGMAFDAAGALYVTGFTAAKVAKFDASGTSQGTFGSGYDCHPESIVFDVAGNAYVGQAGCSNNILKFDSTGSQLASFRVLTEDQGSDWVDLSSDQCTLFYTSEGHQVLRYDVCRSQQLAVFSDQLHKGLAIRLLSDGGLLVADNVDIHRLDASGKIISTYDLPGEDCWVGLTLDPDGTSFWAADACTSNVYKFAIASGSQLQKINAGTGPNSIFGLGMNAKVVQTTVAGEMSASPANMTVKAGQPASFSVTIAPSADTSGKTFSLSCANLPAGASCSFSPSSVTVGATNTSVLTINTTPATVGALRPQRPNSWKVLLAMFSLVTLPIGGLLLISQSSSRKRKYRFLAMLVIALFSLEFLVVACGGGANTTKTFAQSATPSGTFKIIVVGVSGSTQTTTTVTLGVN